MLLAVGVPRREPPVGNGFAIHSPADQPSVYRSLLHRDFMMDLEVGAYLAKRLFLGQFLYSNVPARMVQFMRRSPTLSMIVQDLFAGTQNYLEPHIAGDVADGLAEYAERHGIARLADLTGALELDKR